MNVSIDLITQFCWPWRAGKQSRGYGSLRVGGQQCLAHRMAWTVHRGPIPDGLCVLHRCDNPICVNPDHLFLGTQLDNMLDKMRKGRLRFGLNPQRGHKNGNAKLTALQATAIRASKERTVVLAFKLRVSKSTIERVKSGQTYRGVV